MGVPAAARIRTPCASSPTGKATVHPEESLRSGAPALEGHVLAGPYPQLVGLVVLHHRERADIGARVLAGPPTCPPWRGIPLGLSDFSPPNRYTPVEVLAGPHQLADPGGSRRHTRATGTGASSCQGMVPVAALLATPARWSAGAARPRVGQPGDG
jgi:hypothetical protein